MHTAFIADSVNTSHPIVKVDGNSPDYDHITYNKVNILLSHFEFRRRVYVITSSIGRLIDSVIASSL